MPLILLNKPFGILSQFSDSPTRPGLAGLIAQRDVYPAGRLDADSEGLLLLTDDGALQAHISHPRHKLEKTYLVQVEGRIDAAALTALTTGVSLRDGPARALQARAIEPPDWLWPRDPPVRYRASVPDAWLEVVLDEGRNRQVRRMTAAVGLPTLRLLRTRVGPWSLQPLLPGQACEIPAQQAWQQLRAWRQRTVRMAPRS